MYMRLLRVAVPEEHLGSLRSFYLERVLPSLAEMPGCEYASLLEPSLPGGHCLSLTLWRDQRAADDYEHSGLFDTLLEEVRPVLGQGAEASAETPVAGDPSSPELEEYELVAGSRDLPVDTTRSPLHLRLVSMLVQSGRQAEIAALYRDDIVPALERIEGCLGAFLLQGIDRPDHTLSVTLWERDEDAVRYELSGAYDQLVGRLRGVLSGLYQWRLSQVTGAVAEVGGGHLDVHRYRVVADRRMAGEGPGDREAEA